MRHHTEYIAALVQDAGNRVDGAVVVPVRVDRAVRRGIPEQHAPLAFQPRNGFTVGDIIAFAMRNRHANDLAGIVAAREWRVGALDAQINVVAYEAQVSIAHQDAWQQASLTQDLEAVADAKHQSAARGMGAYCVHDRAARRDRSTTQVIAI